MFPRKLILISMRYFRGNIKRRIPMLVAKGQSHQNIQEEGTSFQGEGMEEQTVGFGNDWAEEFESYKTTKDRKWSSNNYANEKYTREADDRKEETDDKQIIRYKKKSYNVKHTHHDAASKESLSKDFRDKANMPSTSFTNKFHWQELLDFKTLLEFSVKHSEEGPICPENSYDRLLDTVLPLWQIPYKSQLLQKQTHMAHILMRLQSQLVAMYPDKIKENYSLSPCELSGIRYSGVDCQYRNCSDFSVNKGIDGNPKTVGFYVGKPSHGNFYCVEPDHLPNLKTSHITVAKHFQNFIRSMPYETCLDFNDGGVWKNILVRSTLDGQLLIVAKIYHRELTTEQIDDIQNQFKNYFLTGPGKECGVTSILVQCSLHTKSTHEVAPFIALHGDPYIVETINEQTFAIRPDSFFQTNSLGAAILFNAVRDMVGKNPHATVLETCCGTGAMGMQVAPYVRSVIGIDPVQSSIEDAKHNAARNNLKNCIFFEGKIEKLLPELIEDFSHTSEVIVIINPPKNGLNSNTINMLRMCPSIRKIIYVSCRPSFAFKNFDLLCQRTTPRDSKKKMPPRFKPTYAIPVDMFPHTPYVELVITFERVHNRFV